jgi:hypothetical protein
VSKVQHIDENLIALYGLFEIALRDDKDGTVIPVGLPRGRVEELRDCLYEHVIAGKTLAVAFGRKRGPKGATGRNKNKVAEARAIKAAQPNLGWHIIKKRVGWEGERGSLYKACCRQEEAERKAAIDNAFKMLEAFLLERETKHRSDKITRA